MIKTIVFNIVSWFLTAIIVIALLAFAFWRINTPEIVAPVATDAPPQKNTQPIPTSSAINVAWLDLPAIERKLTLKTNIPQRPQYQVLTITVQRGDAIARIAREYKIDQDTLLFANYDVLRDSPDSLQPGQELNIPPIDGILHKWEQGDTLEKVAAEYKAKLEDITNWPGNKIDLTNPFIKADEMIMVPGGTRESRAQQVVIADVGGPGGCAAGASGRGFFAYPTGNGASVSGNDYSGGHPGIDFAANEGDPIYATDGGVVTFSADGYNAGYGSMVQIYHGRGITSLYAHLSQRNVQQCQVVGGGTVIGYAGNTGNSFGAHLHFEIRAGGSAVSPWDYMP